VWTRVAVFGCRRCYNIIFVLSIFSLSFLIGSKIVSLVAFILFEVSEF